MSVRLMNAVWSKQVSGAAQSVLLVLCDFANDEGVCWPSQAVVAWKVGVSDRTVRTVIADLEAMGAITTLESGQGRGRTSVLQINLAAIPEKPEVGDRKPEITTSGFRPQNRKHGSGFRKIKPEVGDRKPEVGDNDIDKELDPSRTTKKRNTYTPVFESFWSTWPKQGDTKVTAFRAWQRLTEAERALAVAGLTRWLPEYQRRENRFIPDCSTWLNQRRWENDPPSPDANRPVPLNGKRLNRDGSEYVDFAALAAELKAQGR